MGKVNFFSPSDLDTDDPVHWYIEKWLASDALTVTIGDGGSGKSLLWLDICIALASGQETIFGTKHDPIRVGIFDEDGGRRRLKRRLKALCNGRSIDYHDILGKTLFVNPRHGIDIWNPTTFKEVHAAIETNQLQLSMVDALIAIHSLVENNNDDMKKIMRDRFVALIDATGCGFSVLHHEGKQGEVAKTGVQRSRGATEIINSSDDAWEITEGQTHRIVTRLRTRDLLDDEWPAPLEYHLLRTDSGMKMYPGRNTLVTALARAMADLKLSTTLTVRDAQSRLAEAGHKASTESVWKAQAAYRSGIVS